MLFGAYDIHANVNQTADASSDWTHELHDVYLYTHLSPGHGKRPWPSARKCKEVCDAGRDPMRCEIWIWRGRLQQLCVSPGQANASVQPSDLS